jgi:hypothetical protein
MGWCLTPWIWTANVIKYFLIVCLKATIFEQQRALDVKIFLPIARTADEFNTRCGAHLFDSFLVCPRPILVVSGLLPGGKQFDYRLPQWLRSAPSQKRQVETYKPAFSGDLQYATGFLQISAACHYQNSGGPEIKFLFYIVNVNFTKRNYRYQKMFKYWSGSYWRPPLCLFDTLFRVSVPVIFVRKE